MYPENQKPAAWGKDHLTRFFDAARSNSFAGFVSFPDYAARMIAIDDIYETFLEDLVDPEDILAAGLAMRCHSALKAAAQLALSGQVTEAMTVLRGALEMALYGHHASTTEERTRIWLNRDEDEETKKKCKQEFTPRSIFPVLRSASPAIGDVAGELYDRMIDYGAHPNARGVLTTMIAEENESDHEFSFAYLTGDRISLEFGLRSWCQIAVSSLDVLSLIFPNRFAALGLPPWLNSVRRGL